MSEHDTKSDALAQYDGMIEVLRQSERDLEIELRVSAARLDYVRELIASMAGRKPRAVRKPRIVEATDVAADAPAEVAA